MFSKFNETCVVQYIISVKERCNVQKGSFAYVCIKKVIVYSKCALFKLH